MAKTAKPLTALDLKRLKQGTVAVGGVSGLYLRKAKYQSYFFLRFTDANGRHDVSLGNYPDMSLAKARAEAVALRNKISQGDDILAERERQRKKKKNLASRPSRITFSQVAYDWIRERSGLGFWDNDEKGEDRTTRILEMYVFPHIGDVDINKVTVEDVFQILSPIWNEKRSTASKAKTFIYHVFRWAIAKKICKQRENPGDVRGSLGVLLEPLQKHEHIGRHHAACPVSEIPRFFADTERYDSASARACEFAILTCCRSKAVRLATWDEFDLKNGIWTIPVEHDKIKHSGRDRRVFLSEQAVELLRSLPRYPGKKAVFPSSMGAFFSDAALTMFLRGMHEARLAEDGRGWVDPNEVGSNGKPAVITLHGTARATFRTWAKDDKSGNNRKFDQEAVEMCLLHSRRDMYKGAYDRSSLENERRLIMNAWGKYCLSMRNSRCHSQTLQNKV